MWARSSGSISRPSSGSWRTVSAMSRALWKITAFVSKAVTAAARTYGNGNYDPHQGYGP